MKMFGKLALGLGIAFLASTTSVSAAPDVAVYLSAPENNQIFETDVAPQTINIVGVITPDAGNAKNYNFAIEDNGLFLKGLVVCANVSGRLDSCNFSVPVDLGFGRHDLEITVEKEGKVGKAYVTVFVNPSLAQCDDIDPPGWANHYMNWLDDPNFYAQLRGKVINQIAKNHSVGKYGTCTFDYELVEDDVDALLEELLQQ